MQVNLDIVMIDASVASIAGYSFLIDKKISDYSTTELWTTELFDT